MSALPRSPRARLAAEILAAYARIRVRLWRTDLPQTLAAVRAAPSVQRPVPPAADPARLARAVSRTLPLLPTESRCLMRSLVLTALLARRGIEGDALVIAVAPGEPLRAHAWVELDGRPLLPPGGAPFERIATL